MRSVLSRFNDWSASNWVVFLIQSSELRDKVRTLVLSVPDKMIDLWVSCVWYVSVLSQLLILAAENEPNTGIRGSQSNSEIYRPVG